MLSKRQWVELIALGIGLTMCLGASAHWGSDYAVCHGDEGSYHCHSRECAKFLNRSGEPTGIDMIDDFTECEIGNATSKIGNVASKIGNVASKVVSVLNNILPIILLLSGFIGSIIGSKKRLVWEGFFISVALGPLGWAIVLSMKGDRMPCPYCKELILENAKLCKHCNHQINQHISLRKRLASKV